MIIAWTLFIIFALIAVGALIGAAVMVHATITESFDRYGDAAVGYTVMAIAFIVATAICAQYIWGGGL